MPPRPVSSVAERLAMVRMKEAAQPLAEASRVVGFGRDWGRKWWRRYRRGGEAALDPAPRPAPGPLARFAPLVATKVLAYRRDHPRLGEETAPGRGARLLERFHAGCP